MSKADFSALNLLVEVSSSGSVALCKALHRVELQGAGLCRGEDEHPRRVHWAELVAAGRLGQK